MFSDWAFMWDLGLIVVVGHGASFLFRRANINGWLAIPLTTAILLWVLVAQRYTDTMSWMVPTGATWDRVQLELGLVRDQFQTEVAPVLYGAGWATLAGFAMIVVVVMSDSFAFRAEARGETLVPGGVLFVFIAALSSPRLRVLSAALLLGGGVIVVIALRRLHDRSRRVELSARRGPVSMVVPATLATALAVALLAGFIGPRLPGAQAEPLYKTRGRGGGVTSVVNPLVDIRTRLTNRGNVELFRVNADAPAYWRVTTLPEFDGDTFGVPTRALERIEGEIDPAPASDSGNTQIRQQIQVLSLGGKLVPAAADPFQADGFSGGQRIDLRLNRETGTLVTPEDIAAGDVFSIVSTAPQLSADVLRAATSSAPPDPIFLELPEDLPEIVGRLADEVTEGAPTTYDAAIALQTWFRDDFEYSLEAQRGHSASAIESFLIQRIGYCEQFSATFAAMARTLGIPSRVAVGFTPGLLADDGWFRVLGKNAHAWPELWFDGIGWVAFEPTPGRGEPGADYTGLEPEQDETATVPAGGTGDPNIAPNPTPPSTVVPTPTSLPNNDQDGRPRFEDLPPVGGETPGSSTGGPSNTSKVPWLVLFIGAIAIALAVAPWALVRIGARRRRSLGETERVQRAWENARASAQLAGVAGAPSMTATEWAHATANRLPVAARPMRSLADLVDRVTYAPPGSIDLERIGTFGATVGQDSELWSEQVGRIAIDTLSPAQRIRRYFTAWH